MLKKSTNQKRFSLLMVTLMVLMSVMTAVPALAATTVTDITFSAPNFNQPAGSTAVVTATAVGATAPMYQWWVKAPGATGAECLQAYSTENTFSFSKLGTTAGKYEFWVTAVNSADYNDGSPAAENTFTKYFFAYVGSAVTLDSAIVEGGNLTVTATSANLSDPDFQFWYSNNPSDSGSWQCSWYKGDARTGLATESRVIDLAGATGTFRVIAYAKDGNSLADMLEYTVWSSTMDVQEQALKVESVSAINATQLMVIFNKEVNKTDAETLAIYSIGGAQPISAVLQSDKKSVLLTTALITGTNLYIVNPVKSAIDATEKSPIFTYVETYSDTMSPTFVSTEYPTFDKAKITFSEPMKSLGTVTFTQNGVPVTVAVLPAFAAGDSSVTYDLSDVSVALDKPVTVVMVGARDQADNLTNPNQLTFTLTKVKTDITLPTVSSVQALSDTRVSVTFSEKLSTNPTVTVNAQPVTFPAYDPTKDNITFTGTTAPAVTGVATIAVAAGYTDMSGNPGDAYSVLAQFTSDITLPALTSTEVKTIANNPYVVFHYSEDVTPVGGSISGTRVKDYISNSYGPQLVTPVAYTIVNGAPADDTKAVMLDISSDVTFPVGQYTVTIPAGFVADMASTPNNSASVSVTFTKGTTVVTDTTPPTVNALPAFTPDNAFMNVAFSEDMDSATALNVANYKVGGVSIFSSAIFDADAQHVKLTVIPGTITSTGDRQVVISGAKDKAGNLMTAYNNIVNVKENVKPYIASAKLTAANTIEVTMSEDVTGIGAATDIEVYIDGQNVVYAALPVYANPKATITLDAPITDLSKTIQVKLVDATVADLQGNLAVTGTMVTVTH